jgi:hypothetical protein
MMSIICDPNKQAIAAETAPMPRQRALTGKATRTTALLVTLGTLILAPVAFGVPPYQPDLVKGGNKWSFRAYDDSSPNHTELVVAQGICFEYAGFKGNHQLYTWYSDSFPGWSGMAVQNGDQIFLHGDYAKGAGHTTIQIETLVAPTPPQVNGSAGYWQEWRENGANGVTVGFATTRSLREGACLITAKQAAALAPLLIGNPLTTNVAP